MRKKNEPKALGALSKTKPSPARAGEKNEPITTFAASQDEAKPAPTLPKDEPGALLDSARTNPISGVAEVGFSETPIPDSRSRRRRRASHSVIAQSSDGPAITEGTKFQDEANPN